jgi:hypothetical protein
MRCLKNPYEEEISMKQVIGKFLEKFGRSPQNTEVKNGFEGESVMKREENISFRKLAKKYGVTTATILAGETLLEGKETLSHDEWWDVYLASPCKSVLSILAEAKMLETATTANQLARRIGAYSKEEHLRYLVKAAGMASTMEELAKLYLASNRADMSDEYKMARDLILQRMKIMAKIW